MREDKRMWTLECQREEQTKQWVPLLALGLALGLTAAALLLLSVAAWASGGMDAALAAGIQSGGTLEMESIHPVSNTHGAPLTTSVSITYDEPMSATTVSTATFALHAMQTGLLSQTYGVKGGTIALTPTRALKPGELVQISATTGTVGVNGSEPLTPTVWQFQAETLGGSGILAVGSQIGPGDDKTEDVALGDLDGDGNLDLVVVNWAPTSTVYLGDGDGTFDDGHNFGDVGFALAVALGDLDGDGDLDIVRGRSSLNEVCLNDGTVPFSTTCHTDGNDWRTRDVALGDMDGDGDLDMVLANEEQRDAVLFNSGDGTFPDGLRFGADTVMGKLSYDVDLGDLDGDGDLDVVVSRYAKVRVYLNNGDGTLSFGGGYGSWTTLRSYCGALGDLDGDGDLDIALGLWGARDKILLNDGDGTFDTTIHNVANANTWPYDLDLGDMDGDGDLDLILGNRDQDLNRAYGNHGDGTFAEAYEFGSADRETRGAALGDLDGDGDLDLVEGNYKVMNVWYRNRHLADLSIRKNAVPLVNRLAWGQTVTYTLTFENVGVVTATGVVISDMVPAGFANWTVAGNSGAAIAPIPGHTFAWTVADLAPGKGGVITITGQATSGQCGNVVNTATITTTSPDEVSSNNQDTVMQAVGVPLYVESIDAGASLAVNGAAAPALSSFCFDPGQTVTLTTSFDGEVYYDVIEAHYDLDVAVRALITDFGQVFLDEDMGYTPYDIYVIHYSEDDDLDIEMGTPPIDGPVRILGLHTRAAWTELYYLGDPAHSGSPVGLADVFYGTVETNGGLEIMSMCDGEIGSALNKIVADEVEFGNSDCSDAADQMVQELYAGMAETYDTEITWWHMVVTGQFATGSDFEGYSLNDELPELATLEDDPMVWFKARNPDKWDLPPLTQIGGQGYDKAWDFENEEYGDYDFWEMHLGSTLVWTNTWGSPEYAHFLGPVMEMDRFVWTPDDTAYLNFFGDNSTNYDSADRFDGDYGSAGTDFWTPLLTTTYGYRDTDGNIVSPVFVWRLREGYFEGGWYTTNLYLANGQDLLILSDLDQLWFHDTDPEYGIHFFQGAGAHWVVEDDLTYSDTVPTDDVFGVTLVDFITSTEWAPVLVVSASNDYDGSGAVTGIQAAGDDVNSTMYLAYREVGAYGQQLTKVPMTYDASSGHWSVRPGIAPGVYDFYIVATENDGVYGKVIERLGVQIFDVLVDESPPIADAGAPQEVVEGQVVQLDGSGSYDPDGNEPLTYGWMQTGGTPAVSLSDSSVVSPTFAASSAGVLVFSLTVTDTADRVSMPDTVTITITEKVTATYGLALVPDRASTVEPGDVLTCSHVLTNTGSGPDTFDLALTSSQNWATMDITPVSLGAGQTATLAVRVAAPAAAVSGTVDVAVLTATSQGGGMNALVTDTTTVVVASLMWQAHLPMVLKGH